MLEIRKLAAGALAAASIALSPVSGAQTNASEASAVSLLPVAVSVTAPAVMLAGSVSLTVVAVEASVDGTVWIVERASDGARVTLRFAGEAAGGVSKAVGTAIEVTAVSGGWVLCAAGHAIAFVPNEIGKALLHNERVSR